MGRDGKRWKGMGRDGNGYFIQLIILGQIVNIRNEKGLLHHGLQRYRNEVNATHIDMCGTTFKI